MDPKKHFDQYRSSVLKDILSGSVEFSKTIPSADPEIPGSYYDYLNTTLNYTKDCVSSGSKEIYKAWVTKHQQGMIGLFERMVLTVLGEVAPTPEQLFDLIHKRGWSWFKFSRHACQINMTFNMKDGPMPIKMIWVPRYDIRWKKDWEEPGSAALDAGELSLIWKTTPPQHEVLHPIILFKAKSPGHRILEASLSDLDIGVKYRPVEKINTPDEVVDWSLPLF